MTGVQTCALPISNTEWFDFDEAGRVTPARSTSETDATNASQGEEQIEATDLMELHVATHKASSGHKMGIGVVSKQKDSRIRAEWALVDRSSHMDIQDAAVAVRLALIKAAQLGWQRIKVINGNKQLIGLLKTRKGNNPNIATLVEDILALANLFHMCFFEEGKSTNMALCKTISSYALSIVMDEERFVVSP